MDLPKKDKHGVSRLSYSQISCFKKSRREYVNRYILKQPFIPNAYVTFGKKVGEAIQMDDYGLFKSEEVEILNSVLRLDVFEKYIRLDYLEHGFFVNGFIDSISEDRSLMIDYKTGGPGKDEQYGMRSYDQLAIYALAIKQMYGEAPKKAMVQFISREGNPYKRIPLKIGQYIRDIEVDISPERLKYVYWDTLKTAKEIADFYKQYKESNP